MPDVRSNGTEQPLSVSAAGSTIAQLLSAKPEEKQKSEAPRPETEPEKGEVEETEPETTDDSEHQPVEEEETEDDDVDADPPKPEPRKLKVKIDGQEIEVTEDEAAKGYSRTEDYTRKTQKLADERKAFEAEATGVRAERQRYAQQLAQLDQLLTNSAGEEPDWDTLRNQDPAVFAATYAAWDQHQKRIASVRTERAKAEAKVANDQAELFKQHLTAEATKLTEAIPEWKDAEKAKAAMNDIASYARTQGYTDDELAAVADHRVFKILRDAALYRKSQAKAPEIEKKIAEAKVLVPGSANQKRPVSELTRRKQALAKTHSLQDAGAAIALML
jgi:hypothetical protein